MQELNVNVGAHDPRYPDSDTEEVEIIENMWYPNPYAGLDEIINTMKNSIVAERMLYIQAPIPDIRYPMDPVYLSTRFNFTSYEDIHISYTFLDEESLPIRMVMGNHSTSVRRRMTPKFMKALLKSILGIIDDGETIDDNSRIMLQGAPNVIVPYLIPTVPTYVMDNRLMPYPYLTSTDNTRYMRIAEYLKDVSNIKITKKIIRIMCEHVDPDVNTYDLHYVLSVVLFMLEHGHILQKLNL